MKTITMIAALLMLTGCHGIDRLINGPEGTPQPDPEVISSVPAMAPNAPNFNVPTPAGTTRVVYYGELPATHTVQIAVDPAAPIDVFMLDRGIRTWFKLEQQEIPAFWYTYDAAAGVVTYHGRHLEMKGFCVYQYRAAQP